MKRQVGDKVKIKSREWYEDNRDDNGYVKVPNGFTRAMTRYCGKDAIIRRVGLTDYSLDIDQGLYCWSDEMFEDEPTEQTKPTESVRHTPGPWNINCTDKAIEKNKSHYTIDTDSGEIALVKFDPAPDKFKQGEANAILIAAAPEMLEALYKIATRGRGVLRSIAQEAIKKATQP